MTDFAERLAKVRKQIEEDRFGQVPLLRDQQFTNADVEAAAYVTSTQLHNWVSRGWIQLSGANPGKGRRRLYSGGDTIHVAIAAALQPFGLLQDVGVQIINRTRQIISRAEFLLAGAVPYGHALAIVRQPDDDDWLYIPLYAGQPEPDSPLPSCVLLDVDRIIVETLENLLLIVDGKPVQARVFPPKKTDQEAADEFLEFTGQAYRDETGKRVWRGLTPEESEELEGLIERQTDYRSKDGPRPEFEETERYLELEQRNSYAAMQYNADRRQKRAAGEAA